MTTPLLIAALTAGLVSSLHCVGMCGPLALALPLGRFAPAWRGVALGFYHLGRIMAYAGLGLLAGFIGAGIWLSGWQQPLAIGAGLCLITWPLWRHWVAYTWAGQPSTAFLTRRMAQLWQRPTVPIMLLLGALNGLLPCGMVYLALAGALITGHTADGVLYMLAFGLGTVPALVAVRLLPSMFSASVRQRFTQLRPAMLVALGLLLLARGVYPAIRMDAHTQQPTPVCHPQTAIVTK